MASNWYGETMAIVVTRAGTVVTAFVAGEEKVMRTETCRNVQGAVALNDKLAGDPSFAARWVRDRESPLPVSIPSKDERQPATGW